MGAAPDGRPLASAGMRVLARFLDSVIVGLVFGFIFSAVILTGDDGAGVGGFGADASLAKLYLLGLLGVAASFVWDAVATKQLGGTPMKLAFGMRVVQQDGSDVEWEHAIKRWALPGAFGLIPPLVGLSLLTGLAQFVIVVVSLVFIFSKPLRTAVWDLFAGTIVVTTR
jgi:uncharacterized RDD family membrane protein YckC